MLGLVNIRISRLTFKKTKLSKESSILDHLVQFDNNPSFDEFIISAHRNKKYLLEIKENLLIKSGQRALNLRTLVPLREIYSTRFIAIGLFLL